MRTRSRHRLAGTAAALLSAALVAVVVLPTQVAVAAPTPTPTPSSSATSAPKKQLQTFGIAPARPSGPDGRPNYVFAGKPGMVVKDNVALVNYTFKPVEVTVYAKDAFTSSSGTFGALEAGQTSKDLGSWISLKSRDVTIPARQNLEADPGTVVVPFSVTVPRDAAPGDHAAAIVVSSRTEASRKANSVVIDRRVGTRVYLRVAGALDPQLGIAGLSVAYKGTPDPIGKGLTRIKYTVRNAGNVVLSARQNVEVTSWFNTATPAKQPVDLVQLLPGAAVDVTTDVAGVWPTFRPAATVTLVPYTGTAKAPVDLKPVSATTHFWAIPWTLIAVVAAILFALLGWYAWRRRRPRDLGAHAAPPSPDSE